jgi:Putative peptidoglycan binding domain/LysM domain
MSTGTGTNAKGGLNAAGPVGQGNYVVQPGDCIESIAFDHGFKWQTLWNLPANAELKSKRKPNLLLPGDLVTIPPIRPRKESRATDQNHKFRLLGTPSRLQLRFLDDKQQPRSGIKYVLTIDGQIRRGSLDGAGKLNVPIPPDARQGSITLQTDPEPEIYPLNFGHLDPISSPTGLRGRLNNLGFSCASDGDFDADLQGAIMRFQLANNLQPTGQLDDKTREALQQGHQS